MGSIFKSEAKEERVSVTDLGILVVLVLRDFSRLVDGIKLVGL
jgi:hypothetical protein